MMTFIQWLEQAGDATMMMGNGDGYDQGLQSDVGLAYRSPEVPDKKSLMHYKLERLFGKRKRDKEDEQLPKKPVT